MNWLILAIGIVAAIVVLAVLADWFAHFCCKNLDGDK